jgi:hypothetical protein
MSQEVFIHLTLGGALDRAAETRPHRARATYTLERGIWAATCRVCGFTTKDPNRSRAAAAFLAHIRAGRQLRAEEAELQRTFPTNQGDGLKEPGLPVLAPRAAGPGGPPTPETELASPSRMTSDNGG